MAVALFLVQSQGGHAQPANELSYDDFLRVLKVPTQFNNDLLGATDANNLEAKLTSVGALERSNLTITPKERGSEEKWLKSLMQMLRGSYFEYGSWRSGVLTTYMYSYFTDVALVQEWRFPSPNDTPQLTGIVLVTGDLLRDRVITDETVSPHWLRDGKLLNVEPLIATARSSVEFSRVWDRLQGGASYSLTDKSSGKKKSVSDKDVAVARLIETLGGLEGKQREIDVWKAISFCFFSKSPSNEKLCWKKTVGAVRSLNLEKGPRIVGWTHTFRLVGKKTMAGGQTIWFFGSPLFNEIQAFAIERDGVISEFTVFDVGRVLVDAMKTSVPGQ